MGGDASKSRRIEPQLAAAAHRRSHLGQPAKRQSIAEEVKIPPVGAGEHSATFELSDSEQHKTFKWGMGLVTLQWRLARVWSTR